MDPAQLAAEVTTWLERQFTPTGIINWNLLLALPALDIDVTFKHYKVEFSALDRTVHIPTQSWEDVFQEMAERGKPFILVSPDHQGEPEMVTLDADEANDDEEEEEPTPTFISVSSLEQVAKDVLSAATYLIDSKVEHDARFVYSWELAGALATLITGSDPGRSKSLSENKWAFSMEALHKART